MSMYLLAGGRVVMTVKEPEIKGVGAVAYVTLDVSALPKEAVVKLSAIKVTTNIIQGVVFKSHRTGQLYVRFSDSTPPAYHIYLRYSGIKQELLDKVESLYKGVEV